jgi:hypothetical protein
MTWGTPMGGWMLAGIEGRWIAIFIVAAVLLFNAGLIYGLLSGGIQQQIDMLRRAADRARHPWAHEDKALEALHEKANRLRGVDTNNDD